MSKDSRLQDAEKHYKNPERQAQYEEFMNSRVDEKGKPIKTRLLTAQMQWIKNERDCLVRLFEKHGYKIKNPGEHRQHLDTQDYIESKDKNLQEKNLALYNELSTRLDYIDEEERELAEKEKELKEKEEALAKKEAEQAQKEAEKKVKIGDTCRIAPSLTKLMNGRVYGRPIDDRIGCLMLFEAAKKLCQIIERTSWNLKRDREHYKEELQEELAKQKDKIFNEGVKHGRNLLMQLNNNEITPNQFVAPVKKYSK